MEETRTGSPTVIEHLVEGKNVVIPDYSGRHFSEEEIAKGTHRDFVSGSGGQWDEGGLGQLTFLRKQGLRPEHRFVDIGCGALRAGRHLVDHLDRGNYYGVDANLSLLQAGYDHELTDAQRQRLPVGNLRANDRFNVDFGVRFDMAIAQSVFTHVSLNHMRLCLHRLARVMNPGGTFYASYFEQPEDRPVDHTFQMWSGGRTYFFEKNVYWYHRSALRWAASGAPWTFRYVGDYGSSQKQVMAAYTRMTDEEFAGKQRADERLRARRSAIRAGGPKALVLRVRRKAARIIDPGV